VSIWTDMGFRDNPYQVTPVPATAEGNELLVGREAELHQLITQLESLDTHPTLEGENGAGKTSLVSVATYRLLNQWLTAGAGPLFLPLGRAFQLDDQSTIDAFRREVYFQVARAFINHKDLINQAGVGPPPIESIAKWLDAPIFRSGEVSVLGSGAGGGSEPNTSAGFEEAGFRDAVTNWLSSTFPSSAAGSFVCTLDNLELLDTSQRARAMLEAARDSVFALPGLKWVLCGARGIVRSAAASPRLQGVLADPMEVGPLPDDVVSQVIARRVEVFKMAADVYVPVDERGFEHIYGIMRGNLRNALGHSQDFTLWLIQQRQPDRADEKFALLEIWWPNWRKSTRKTPGA
jgi:hypothetical protein